MLELITEIAINYSNLSTSFINNLKFKGEYCFLIILTFRNVNGVWQNCHMNVIKPNRDDSSSFPVEDVYLHQKHIVRLNLGKNCKFAVPPTEWSGVFFTRHNRKWTENHFLGHPDAPGNASRREIRYRDSILRNIWIILQYLCRRQGQSGHLFEYWNKIVYWSVGIMSTNQNNNQYSGLNARYQPRNTNTRRLRKHNVFSISFLGVMSVLTL